MQLEKITIELCPLCENTLDLGGKTVVPTTRGRNTFKRSSEGRGDTVFMPEGKAVREECCSFNIPYHLKKEQEKEIAFNINHNLIPCRTEVKLDARNALKVYPVRSVEFKNTSSRVLSEPTEVYV